MNILKKDHTTFTTLCFFYTGNPVPVLEAGLRLSQFIDHQL
jgi:hypothetical protein